MENYGLPAEVVLKNNRKIQIRNLKHSDVDGVWINFNEVVAERSFLPVYTPVVSKWEKNNWLKEIEQFGNFCLVAIDPRQKTDREVVGQITIEDIPWEAAEHVSQLGIIVQKYYRNLGMGYHLIQYALAKAKRRGKKKIILSTLASNERGIHLYQKCGFSIAGKYSKQYLLQNNYEDELLMENWIE